MTVLVVFAIVTFSRNSSGLRIIELISLVLILAGLCLAIAALTGIRRHGKKGILGPALAGLVMNGFLLAIFVTNFSTARSKALQASSAVNARQTAMTPSRLADFRRSDVTFRYDSRYKVSPFGVQGQIHLEHPYSQVMLTRYNEATDVNEALRSAADQMRAVFEQKHYTEIRLGPVEPVSGAVESAAKITISYTRPGGDRSVSDVYFISTETNATSLAHFYSESHSRWAASLFEEVLKSFVK